MMTSNVPPPIHVEPLLGKCVIGVLVPIYDGEPAPPEDKPIGRAALALADEGIAVIFGQIAQSGELSGWYATPGAWQPVFNQKVSGVYDRFPSQSQPEAYKEIIAGLDEVPIFNAPIIHELCRDKFSCQMYLEKGGIKMPSVSNSPSQFQALLSTWGSAFLKPRFGSFGLGVQKIENTDSSIIELEPRLQREPENWILQKAVPPPQGIAAMAIRILAQRDSAHTWSQYPAIARISQDSPVANHRTGAEVVLASELVGKITLDAMAHQVEQVCARLSNHPAGKYFIECGIDFSIDPQGTPHLLEVNTHPRGRLEVLCQQHSENHSSFHLTACMKPLRTIAALMGRKDHGALSIGFPL